MQQTKAIMEELARARNYFHRHDVLRTMISVATAIKTALTVPLAGRDKSLIENGVQEIVQMLNRTQEVKRYCTDQEGLVMRRGQLKPLFKSLMVIIKTVREEALRESEEQIRNRKLEMDNQLLRGFKFLEGGNAAEADQAFQEAVKLYVDEHKLFVMIGNKLLQAGLARPALKFFLRGLEVDPEPRALAVATARAYAALGEHAKAEALLLRHAKGCDDPDLFAVLAQVQVKQDKQQEGLRSSAMGLRLDPAHKACRQLFGALRKAGVTPPPRPAKAPQPAVSG